MRPDITIVGRVGTIVRNVGGTWEIHWTFPCTVELRANESIRIGAVDVFGPALVDIRPPRDNACR